MTWKIPIVLGAGITAPTVVFADCGSTRPPLVEGFISLGWLELILIILAIGSFALYRYINSPGSRLCLRLCLASFLGMAWARACLAIALGHFISFPLMILAPTFDPYDADLCSPIPLALLALEVGCAVSAISLAVKFLQIGALLCGWRAGATVAVVSTSVIFSLGQYAGWSSWSSFGPDVCQAGLGAFDGCCDKKDNVSGDRLVYVNIVGRCGVFP